MQRTNVKTIKPFTVKDMKWWKAILNRLFSQNRICVNIDDDDDDDDKAQLKFMPSV